MKATVKLILGMILAGCIATAGANEDMPGSSDHPLVPRVDGTHIVGYAQVGYDEAAFLTGIDGRKLVTETVEGKRTKIIYFGSPDMSPLMLLRNYQRAVKELGEIQETFSCAKTVCPGNLPGALIWSKPNRIKNTIPGAGYVYGVSSYYIDQRYWSGIATQGDTRYHVSFYTARFSESNQIKSVRGIPVLHLEIVEVADFEPTLKFVTSEEMTSAIEESGHIALYGIHFDLGSAAIQQKSGATVGEIAAALSAAPALRLYVVGHTDNQGSVEHNQRLSQDRAAAVVAALTGDHGIAATRLIPLGAGLMAPKASNDTEEGRQLNRRVELVKI